MQRPKSWLVAGVFTFGLALVGCGGNESSGDASPTTTASTQTTTSTAVSTSAAETTSTVPVAEIDLTEAFETERPVDGSISDESWLPVLEALDDFAAQRDIGAAVLAIAVDGEPAVEVALGWSDLDRTQPLNVNDRFRIASITKPYTRALALELEAQGLIDLDRQVFCTPGQPADCVLDLVANSADAGRPVADEMADITLRHLIDHTAGFDSNLSIDPMFAPLLVQFDLGIDGLPAERDFATWMLGEPLVHTPGETYAYSNVGYLIAGVAMEEVTGSPYLDLLRTHLDVSDTLMLGSSLPAERASDEVDYACDESTTVNLFDPDGPLTCWADGGFNLEPMTAHGRLVAPASEVLAFLNRRCIDGLENLGSCDTWHDGSLPGTYAVARNFGRVDYVVLFNQRRDPDHAGSGYIDVVETLDSAISAVTGDPFTG